MNNSTKSIQEPLTLDGSYIHKFIDLSKPKIIPTFGNDTFKKSRNLAVFTNIYNEDFFLEIFMNYYQKMVSIEDIYIIDHGSNSVCYDKYKIKGINIIRIPNDLSDQVNITRYVEYFQRFLLTQYKFVLHVDSDELLVHKNGPKYISQVLCDTEDEVVYKPVQGYDMIHDPDHEEELDTNNLVSTQRKFMWPNRVYAKAALSSISASWFPGFHNSMNDCNLRVVEDLYMIHLANVSIKHSIKKGLSWNNLNRSDQDKTVIDQSRRIFKLEDVIENYRRWIASPETITVPDYMFATF